MYRYIFTRFYSFSLIGTDQFTRNKQVFDKFKYRTELSSDIVKNLYLEITGHNKRNSILL